MDRKKLGKAAVGTGAVMTGVGALIGGPLGRRMAGFGMAHMLLGGANLIQARSFKRQLNKFM